MPIVIAAHFAHEICRALDYVHSLQGSDGEPMRVVHRDVTPSNIVLTSAGALKLLDFGVARYSATAAFSEHGAIRGKAAYLAPEALRGDPIDGRVDIFALGVVLHEMLTLKDLFASESNLGTLHKVLEMEIPRPSAARADVPAELDAIVMKALQRDPARRYASAAEMARDLNEFVVSARLRTDADRRVRARRADRARAPAPRAAGAVAEARPLSASAGLGRARDGARGRAAPAFVAAASFLFPLAAMGAAMIGQERTSRPGFPSSVTMLKDSSCGLNSLCWGCSWRFTRRWPTRNGETRLTTRAAGGPIVGAGGKGAMK